ncbi:MAG: hypothetical protein GX354_07625 [Firmicutes bacterium]|nr:hypothetical protein [Bacillota bacterium]
MVGRLEPEIRGLIQHVKAYEELTVEAAVHRDYIFWFCPQPPHSDWRLPDPVAFPSMSSPVTEVSN